MDNSLNASPIAGHKKLSVEEPGIIKSQRREQQRHRHHQVEESEVGQWNPACDPQCDSHGDHEGHYQITPEIKERESAGIGLFHFEDSERMLHRQFREKFQVEEDTTCQSYK